MHILKKCLQRAVSLSLLMVLLACTTTSERAAERYDRGDYVGAIREVTVKLDAKQSYPRSSLKKQWLETVHFSIQKIEDMPIDTLDQKISRLDKVLGARKLTETGFYRDEFAKFNQYYPMGELKLTIAKLYYEKGTSRKGTNTSDYLFRVNAFEKGLEYAPYQDMAALLKNNRFEYSKSLAADYYSDGQSHVKNKNYKEASEAFKKSQDAYRTYGQYKDAEALASKYEKMWRTEAAEQQLVLANQAMQQARTKADYRNAAQAFNKVKSIYSQYGEYKNTNSLYNSAMQKGRVYVAYTMDKVKGINSCGSFSDDDLDKRLSNLIESQFRAYPFVVTTNKSSADFVIDVSYRNALDEGKVNKTRQAQTWIDDTGKERAFTRNSETQSNEFTMRIDLETRGNVRSSDNVKLESSSSYEKHSYTGDLPSDVKNNTKGQLLSDKALCKNTFSELDRKVGRVLSDIEKEARRL